MEHCIQEQQNTHLSARGTTVSGADHVLDHKTSPNKFMNIETISCIFLTIMVWIRNQIQEKKPGKFIYMGRLNSMLSNNQWVKELEDIKIYLETNENGNTKIDAVQQKHFCEGQMSASKNEKNLNL